MSDDVTDRPKAPALAHRQPSMKPGAVRMRRKRALDEQRKARLQAELPVLWEISSELVDQKLLPEWNADDPEAIKKATLRAIVTLSRLKRHKV